MSRRAARVTGVVDDLALAHDLADAADAITTARFRATDLRVDAKPDLTPVTDADRRTEERLREILADVRPNDAVHGEEFADTGSATRRWVIDPIDGTKNFVRGVPVWASLIALMDGESVATAVVSAPALCRRWWASAGGGAQAGPDRTAGTPCRVSAVADLADASLSYSSLSGWEDRGLLDGFLDLARSCWRTRAYGDFWSYMLLAEGAARRGRRNPRSRCNDLAAVALIVTL